ncbi:hypothetical protein LI328DRAFT_155429 [Trichoderma asperelloides]|nr:hypothetical protein LI328DRAFT_155429 [Trichoderma asperelloides]
MSRGTQRSRKTFGVFFGFQPQRITGSALIKRQTGPHQGGGWLLLARMFGEAQLIHHGIQPSKVKSVARMRLFDAVRKGTLAVPSFITDLVKKLKTEWIKREMEDMKKATKRLEAAAASQAGPSLEATTGKRKADVTVNVTINTNLPGSVAFTTAKRARISASLEESSAPARQPAGKQSARRDGSSQALRRQEPASHTSPVPFCLLGQAARLSRPLALQGRICSLTHQDSEDRDYTNPFDQPPPPYQDNYEDQNRHEENHPPVQRARLASLGPLNGRYDISSRSVDEQRPENASRLNLVLTLAGPSLWGRFDLGLVEGVMYFQERPCNSSLDAVQFSWRGHEPNGPISYDDRYNKGWIKFLGDGRIEGWINHLGIYFEGHRISGQGIRSEIDAQTMKRMWDEYYMEDEYEQQNRERW